MLIPLQESPRGGRFAFPLLALVVSALVAAVPASASTLAWTAPASSINLDNYEGTLNLGDVFVANANETVTALGIYAGLHYTTWEDVGLYDAAGNFLADVNINPEVDMVADGYYWCAADPVELHEGDTYTVVIFSNGSDPATGYNNTAPIPGWATFLYDDYNTDTSLSFPTATPGMEGSVYYGANILAVEDGPEPESLLLLASGMIGLAGLLKFRRREN